MVSVSSASSSSAAGRGIAGSDSQEEEEEVEDNEVDISPNHVAAEEEEHLLLNDLDDEGELSSHLSGLSHLLALDPEGETETLSSAPIF